MGAHNKMLAVKKTLDDDDMSRAESMNGSAQMDFQMEIPIDDPSQVILHKEMLQSVASEKKELQLSSECIDFSFVHAGRQSESR